MRSELGRGWGPYIFGPRPYIFRQDRIFYRDRIFSKSPNSLNRPNRPNIWDWPNISNTEQAEQIRQCEQPEQLLWFGHHQSWLKVYDLNWKYTILTIRENYTILLETMRSLGRKVYDHRLRFIAKSILRQYGIWPNADPKYTLIQLGHSVSTLTKPIISKLWSHSSTRTFTQIRKSPDPNFELILTQVWVPDSNLKVTLIFVKIWSYTFSRKIVYFPQNEQT